jgi:O-antigen ligase
MVARRLRLGVLDRSESLLAVAAMAITALLALAGFHKLGSAGLLAPLAVVAVVVLLTRPLLAVCLVVGLTILCEGPTFGILTFTSHFYVHVYKYLTLLDALVGVAVAAVAIDLMRSRRRLWVPGPLRPALVFLALAMIVGAVVGHAAGASIRFALGSEDVLFYLLLLPLAVANLELDTHRVTQLLAGLGALAALKAVLGLIEVAGHYGPSIEGTATLTYYEPAANWLILIAILVVLAAVLTRARAPRWMLLAAPLLFACLLLSYRRSFWIAAVLGIVLVLLIGTSHGGRRLLAQAVIGVALTIWLLGSINFQSQLPIVKRAASLSPSKLEANQQDRYRLDERANVLGAIREHPFTGLGITVPWAATVHPLPVEHEEGRQYVHFAALWFWLKLGILGLAAYIAVMVGAMSLAWKAWRRASQPLLRAFGLASLAGIAGLVAMDTTASFTGVDPRFTVLFAVQLGLLARLAFAPPATQEARRDSTSAV